jgi:hypothetical protein
MKDYKRTSKLNAVLGLGMLFLTACANQATASVEPTEDPQVAAINAIRLALVLPNLPLESKGLEHMINSPRGDLPVAIYVDSEGRKYSLEPETNTVVEIDARNLLNTIPADTPVLSQGELSGRVKVLLSAAIPDFASLMQTLKYEEGGKVDNYFFTWYGDILPGNLNRPFIQVGTYKTGFIFAYYNTVSIK